MLFGFICSLSQSVITQALFSFDTKGISSPEGVAHCQHKYMCIDGPEYDAA